MDNIWKLGPPEIWKTLQDPLSQNSIAERLKYTFGEDVSAFNILETLIWYNWFDYINHGQKSENTISLLCIDEMTKLFRKAERKYIPKIL